MSTTPPPPPPAYHTTKADSLVWRQGSGEQQTDVFQYNNSGVTVFENMSLEVSNAQFKIKGGNGWKTGYEAVKASAFEMNYLHDADATPKPAKAVIYGEQGNIAAKSLSVGGAVTAGAATLQSNLDVTGAATVVGATTLQSTLDVKEKTTLRHLNVQGATDLANLNAANTDVANLVVHGNINVFEMLDVNGEAKLQSTLDVKENTTLQRNLNVQGATDLANLNAANTDVANLVVHGNIDVIEMLDVHGEARLQSTLKVNENTTLRKNLDVTGGITTKGTLTVSAAASLESSLSVGNHVELSDTLRVLNKATLSSDLIVGGEATVAGKNGLSITGGLLKIDAGLMMKGGTTANFSGAEVLVDPPRHGNNPATKGYVDALAAGLTPKDAVRAATHPSWEPPFTEFEAIDADDIAIYLSVDSQSTDLVIDGNLGTFKSKDYLDPDGMPLDDLPEFHPLAHRLLLKDLPDKKMQGVYHIKKYEPNMTFKNKTYAAKWSLRRTSDFNEPTSSGKHSDVLHGAYVFVETGQNNQHLGFMMTNEQPIINAISGDDIMWTAISGAGALTFSHPLHAVGNQINFAFNTKYFELENDSLSLKDKCVGNSNLVNDRVNFGYTNGLTGPTRLPLGEWGNLGISDKDPITMRNIILTSDSKSNPSIKGVHAVFSGNLQCQNILQTSDQRVKDCEAMEAADCLSGIMALEPLVYSLKKSFVDVKGGNTDKHMGLLAQPLEKVFPHAVSTSSEPVKISEDETVADFKSVDYASLVAPLIGAVKALSAKVESLEAKIA